nr:hypothetical protein [Achromobacter pestifer]
MQFRAGHASWQSRRVRLPHADLRQPATRLHAATHRRRARPALGSNPGHNGLTPTERHDNIRRDHRATPRSRPHRADRQ